MSRLNLASVLLDITRKVINMNNKIRIAIISTAVAGTCVISASPVMAASYNESGQKINFFDRVALMVGFKKNLSPEKKAERINQMRQKRDAKLNSRLDALVTQGKISESQKTELKSKLEAIEAIKEANAGKSPQEVKAATKNAREDLKAWAQANNLTLGDIMPAKTHSK